MLGHKDEWTTMGYIKGHQEREHEGGAFIEQAFSTPVPADTNNGPTTGHDLPVPT